MAEVIINKAGGALGRVSASNDGSAALLASGVAVADKFVLGDVLTFLSLADAEALGIDQAYDTANSVLVWQHIKDFYSEAPEGTSLRVMVCASTATMAQMLAKDGDYAAKLLETAGGGVRLLAVSRVPDASYAPTYEWEESNVQMDEDVIGAIAAGQLLAEDMLERNRPVNIFVEARDFQGTIAILPSLRDGNTVSADHVSPVLCADPDVSLIHPKYAAVGLALGRVAGNAVQRNAGRVKDGAVSFLKAGISGNVPNSDITDAQLKSMSDKGYWVLREYDGISGWRFYDDWTCIPSTSDWSSVSRCRPYDKAVRVAYQTFQEELLDDLDVDADTGQLNPAVTGYYQSKIENAITLSCNIGQSDSELSGVECYIDPEQNIISTDKVVIVLKIVPKGMTRAIAITLSYLNPLNS